MRKRAQAYVPEANGPAVCPRLSDSALMARVARLALAPAVARRCPALLTAAFYSEHNWYKVDFGMMWNISNIFVH